MTMPGERVRLTIDAAGVADVLLDRPPANAIDMVTPYVSARAATTAPITPQRPQMSPGGSTGRGRRTATHSGLGAAPSAGPVRGSHTWKVAPAPGSV